MRKMFWLTVLVTLFFVFFLPGILALFVKYIPSNYQPSLDNVKQIYGQITVSQEFTSQDSNLMGVGMTVKNPNLKNKSEFYFTLYDGGGQQIRRVVYSGANVEDGGFIKFLFDQIPDSKGKTYKLTISNPNAGEEEVLGIYYTFSKPDWIGNMVYNDDMVDGGVALVTYHKPQSRLSVVKQVYSSLLSRLLRPNFQK